MAVTRSASTGSSLLRVVIVEDDDTYADMVRKLLISKFDIQRASSLSELLDLGRRQDPDVILLDLRLPDGGDPLALVMKVVARFQETAILVTTGLDDETLALETLRAGAQDYLVKEMYVRDQMIKKIQHAHARKAAVIRANEAAMAAATAASSTSMHILAADPDMLEKKLARAMEKLLEEKVLAKHHVRPRSDVFETIPPATAASSIIELFKKVGGEWKFVSSILAIVFVYITDFRDTVLRTAEAVEENAAAVTETAKATKEFEEKQKKTNEELRQSLIKALVIAVKSAEHTQKLIETADPKINFPEPPPELKAAQEAVREIEAADQLFKDANDGTPPR
jgi:DNA-binding NarL/FixJ family response regulator